MFLCFLFPIVILQSKVWKARFCDNEVILLEFLTNFIALNEYNKNNEFWKK